MNKRSGVQYNILIQLNDLQSSYTNVHNEQNVSLKYSN